MTAGLDAVDRLPAGSGYAEVQVSAVGQAGVSPAWLAALELGVHPVAPLDVFLTGQVGARWGDPVQWQAGAGARLHW